MTTPEQSLLQAIGQVSSSTSILAELTPSAQLAVGGYALGVSEVVLGMLGGGANPGDLAAGATSLVANLVTDLVGGLFASASDAVPIVGEVLGSVIGILGALQAAEDAEEERLRQQREAKCKAETEKWKTIGTGAWGEVLPADYFVQASRDYRNTWTIHRMPFHGQFLRAVLAESWPRWFVEAFRGHGPGVAQRRAMGHDAVSGGAFGTYFATEVAHQVWLGLHDSERERYANADNWPPRPAELRIALKVLDGIAGQHPAILAQAGRPLGEAGREIWPLFCDLLYWLCRVPRPPWWADGVPWENDPAVAALGLVPVPTLNEPVIRGFYSAQTASAQTDSPAAPWTEWDRMRRLELYHLRERPDPIGWCHGYGTAGCNLVYGLADGWRGYAEPVTASDAETRAEQVRAAWEWMEQHLGETGPGSGMRPIGRVGSRANASAAISSMGAALGWTKPAQDQAHAILEAEAKPTATTVRKAAIVGTLGLGAAAVGWALTR
jgi:hypothetical protein